MKPLFSLIFCSFLFFLFFPEDSFSQWYYYGRNKVQYTDFDWFILQTDHFDIYYYPEMEELAEKGAYFAEEGYHYLENKFNFTMNRRIPLILYSSHLHFQQTKCYSFFYPGRCGGVF